MKVKWIHLTNQWEFRAIIIAIPIFGLGFISGTLFGSKNLLLATIGWLGIILVGLLFLMGVVLVTSWVWEQIIHTKYSFDFTRQAIIEKLKRDEKK